MCTRYSLCSGLSMKQFWTGLAIALAVTASAHADVMLVRFNFDGGAITPTWVNPALIGASPMQWVGNASGANFSGNPGLEDSDRAYGGAIGGRPTVKLTDTSTST